MTKKLSLIAILIFGAIFCSGSSGKKTFKVKVNGKNYKISTASRFNERLCRKWKNIYTI